jgi:hypothetical protein
MPSCDRADDGEAESAAPGRAVARGIAAHERLEQPFGLGWVDAGAMIIDMDRCHAVGQTPVDHAAGAVARGIIDQIGEHPPERRGVATHHHARTRGDRHRNAGDGHVLDQAVEQAAEIDPHVGAHVHLVAGIADHGGDHRAHLIHVAFGAGTRIVGQLLDPESESRERCAEVVRDCGEHRRASLGMAGEPPMHRRERLAKLRHFARRAGGKGGKRGAGMGSRGRRSELA